MLLENFIKIELIKKFQSSEWIGKDFYKCIRKFQMHINEEVFKQTIKKAIDDR